MGTHVYTLHLMKDNSYEVFIDGESEKKGTLEEDWDMLKPAEIKDPEASKPEDWVNEKEIDDPEDSKPDGWDADPDAEKPEDWDDEMDGEWEAPMVNNPEFKGEWSAKQIDNPDYKEDKTLYSFKDISILGLDLWQVKAGSVFDNFLMSDDIDAALKEAKQIVEDRVEAEKKMKEPEEEDDEEDVDDEDFEDFDEDEFDGHDEL